MPGEQFSRSHVHPGAPGQDSTRARHGQMFPYDRLSAEEIERRLWPVVQQAYDGDEPAQRAAGEMLTALKAWVEASHEYSRRPGDADPVDPPADIAILAISQGASFLRWLARLGVSPA